LCCPVSKLPGCVVCEQFLCIRIMWMSCKKNLNLLIKNITFKTRIACRAALYLLRMKPLSFPAVWLHVCKPYPVASWWGGATATAVEPRNYCRGSAAFPWFPVFTVMSSANEQTVNFCLRCSVHVKTCVIAHDCYKHKRPLFKVKDSMSVSNSEFPLLCSLCVGL